MPTEDNKLPCGFSIGTWLTRQRTQLRNQRLEGDQICALDNAAPGWRSSIDLSPEGLHKRPTAIELERDEKFTAGLRQAAAYFAEHGRFPPLNSMARGHAYNQIATWIAEKRKFELWGRLSIERVQQLDHSLPGWRKSDVSDEREQRWQDAFADLVARVKELGRLPTSPDPSARWMYRQRTSLKHGRLHEDRLRAVNEAIPGWNKVSSRRESVQRTDVLKSSVKPAVR